MQKLLGFELGAWDYATFAALFVLVLAGAVFLVWLAGLPGRIAIAGLDVRFSDSPQRTQRLAEEESEQSHRDESNAHQNEIHESAVWIYCGVPLRASARSAVNRTVV